MVVVIVIAILAAIAIPSYLSQTRKSRRNAAEAAIQQIALLEERYRADNSGYLDSSGSNWSKLGGNPSGSYYDYAVSIAAATSVAPATYTITATGKGMQLKDSDRSSGTDCKNLQYGLSSTGTIFKIPPGCW